MTFMKHYISLGAGVQSSTMALMAVHGEITPMPEAAIFADTQAEPASVYRWLDWLEKQLPFPVYRVTAGDLSQVEPLRKSKAGTDYARFWIPMHVLTDSGDTAIMLRQCTTTFKIEPIRRKILSFLEKDEMAIQWIGISLDEVDRMKPSQHKRIENSWPLIHKGIRRHNCLDWMQAHGYPPPPRSACVFCPYHSDTEWERLKQEEPKEFEKAVVFEQQQQRILCQSRFKGTPYLHRSLKPLDQVQFVDDRQQNLFRNECEGMCGV